MCGIAGRVNLTPGRLVEVEALRRMCDSIRHRGPDDEGYRLDGQAGIGMRRLSIIDLAGGHQPISNEDGTAWIVFNGEIYNFQELRVLTEQAGHRSSTKSDTEVILHLYEMDGPDCVRRLRGFFAFAIWDGKRRRLMLARDRVGKKPLLYSLRGGDLTFCSEMAGLLTDPGLPRDLDLEAFSHYLTWQYIPPPWTIFKHVRKLPPASTLVWERGKVSIRRYWTLSHARKERLTEPQWGERVLSKLEEATRIRLISEVPLGAFLSGGIDSSAVVGLMARHTAGKVKTFSIGFEEERYSELPHARLVAERFGTDHHEFIVKPDVLEILPALVRHYGEPFADPSAIPTWYVARETRRQVTVALNGDGGDECFAGYLRYLPHRFYRTYDLLPPALRRTLSGLAEMSGMIRSAAILPRRIAKFVKNGALTPMERYGQWISFFDREGKSRVLAPWVREKLGPEHDSWALLDQAFAAADGPDPLDRILSTDIRTYLPGDLLVKMDIATMANSLEARSPFLDHELLELAAQVPAELQVRGVETKALLRRSLRGFLPDEILDRTKHGFSVPLEDWFRGRLAGLLRDRLVNEGGAVGRYCDKSEIRRLVEEHQSGKVNHAPRLWALLFFEMWHRWAVDGESV